MAIRIIEGVPGSGKSYYAVRHLVTNYFELSHDEYVVKKPCTIITNIENFQPDHVSLDAEIKKAGSVEKFFSLEFQEQYRHCFNDVIVYMIDEAQMLFRRSSAKGLSDAFSYFEYHRHFGQDIYLITQNSRKLPPDITALCEYIIVACPRTRSIIGELKYKWLSDGDVIKREGFKPDKRIFALYKSQDQAESEKIKNPIMKTVAIVVIAAALVIGGGFWFFNSNWAHAREKQNKSVDKASTPSSIPAVSSPGGTAQAGSSPSVPAPDLLYFVPLQTITTHRKGVSYVQAVWGGNILSVHGLPHQTIIKNGKWYIVLDSASFASYFPADSDEVPSGYFSVPKG